jgi:4,5-DOPA dioxygenase extradiol
MAAAMPSLFLSHGAPSLAIERGATPDFLRGLGQALGRPRAIVVASAHWETGRPALTTGARPETVHDFHGFPEALYRIRYPAPGDPVLAEGILRRLSDAGIDAVGDAHRGFDHGVWVPLHLMYPQADIPVLALAVQPQLSPRHHYALGRVLAPLRREGVLVIGSGSSTHNLRELSFGGGSTPEWAAGFDQWLATAVTGGHTDTLLDYAAVAPYARRNHPTPEHFLPLFVALGAGGDTGRGRVLYRDFTYGSLSMASFAWD